VALPLEDGVHREGPGAVEPARLARPPVDLEKRVAVSRGPVAEAGSLLERARAPGELAARDEEVVEPGIEPGGDPGEADDHARRAMTPLHEPVGAPARDLAGDWRPVRGAVLHHRGLHRRLGGTAEEGFALPGAEVRRRARQGMDVPGKPVSASQVLHDLAIEVLGPEIAAPARIGLPGGGDRPSAPRGEVPPSLLARALGQGCRGDRGSGRAPEDLVGRAVEVRLASRAEPLRDVGARAQAPRDGEDSRLPEEIGGRDRAGVGIVPVGGLDRIEVRGKVARPGSGAEIREPGERPDRTRGSIAISRGAIVVTGSRRHFERIEGVVLEDWVHPAGYGA
jgi:hypothetical protein